MDAAPWSALFRRRVQPAWMGLPDCVCEEQSETAASGLMRVNQLNVDVADRHGRHQHGRVDDELDDSQTVRHGTATLTCERQWTGHTFTGGSGDTERWITFATNAQTRCTGAILNI